ncbi:hypothetical protein HPB49_010955 [Dermacentor silvarum]|uniref:Uncharacterized protein n=1 Tax=Dermacentor silvarum TaxID=543639 RepID=A0ACB8DZJ7_DERSI|nr:hypothetical protein HPB49_010955 [Dermacentor silvarum]
MCRKGYYAESCMFICDADMRILTVYPMRPGSNHDSFVWRTTWLRRRFQVGRIANPCVYLIGYSGYPLYPWLLTPAEGKYNTPHATLRSVVERCIGLFMSRFRCLQRSLPQASSILSVLFFLSTVTPRLPGFPLPVRLRLDKRLYPPLHPSLTVPEDRLLRHIQMNALITPSRLFLYRYRVDPSCPNCPSTYADLAHCLFHCPAAQQSHSYPPPSLSITTWLDWLGAEGEEEQRRLAAQAVEMLGL